MKADPTVQRAQGGDLHAFNRLVMEYQDQVFRQAWWMMRSRPAAEDATQETFLLAYQKLHTFRGGSFRAWLMKIVTHLCCDELRRHKRHPSLPLEPVTPEGEEVEFPAWGADPGESVEERVESADLTVRVHACLDSLHPAYRSVLVLVDLQEMDYSQAAQILKIPIGTVRSRLARARKRLRDAFQAAGLNPRADMATAQEQAQLEAAPEGCTGGDMRGIPQSFLGVLPH